MTKVTGEFFELNQLEQEGKQARKSYLEFLRIPAMSAGLYTLPAGGLDPQKPHQQDELYYIVRGLARIQVGSEDRAVTAGSVVFVAAKVEHRFHDIQEEVSALVFFAPAETK